ncbi:MAG: protein kinase [bacterium]|nr:protein kinase [bacterium]
MDEEGIFLEAVDIETPAKRREFIDQACGGDIALRTELIALLRAHETAGLLENPKYVPEVGLDELLRGKVALNFLSDSDRGDALGRLGSYDILEVIGRGGMGIVLKAQDKKLDRTVALKVLTPRWIDSELARERFMYEAQAVAKMHHSNIVPLFEVGQEGENVFYAMQLIEGQGLDRVIKDLRHLHGRPEKTNAEGKSDAGESGKIAISLMRDKFNVEDFAEAALIGTPQVAGETGLDTTVTSSLLSGKLHRPMPKSSGHKFYRSIARVGKQVADALEYAHARGIVHRDIKPSNLMLDGNGVVWVTDFGLATDSDKGMTVTGNVMGTPRYMSPERFRGHSDPQSDVYSLGMTLYELALMKPAFETSDRVKLVRMITQSEPAAPRLIDPHIPADLETIILKAIEKSPSDRYPSADALGEDLHRFVNDEPILARRVSPLERLWRWARRNKALAASLSAVAMLLVVLAIGSTVAYMHQAALVREKQAETTKAITAETKAKDAATKAIAAEGRAEREKIEAQTARDTIRRNLYVAEMRSASYAVMQPRGIIQALNMTEKWSGDDLCRWEWYYLDSLCHPRHLALKSGAHPLASPVARWSPDGMRIASISRDSFVLVWDAVSGKLLHEYSPQGRPWLWGSAVRGQPLAWSPDGKQIACCTVNDGVRVLNAETGATTLVIARGSQIFSLGWSSDGACLALGGLGGKLEVRDAKTGKILHSLKGPSTIVRSLHWHPDNKRLASAGLDGSISLWDGVSGKAIRTLKGHIANVWSVCWSPDGKRLASADDIGRIKVWDSRTFVELFEISNNSGRVSSVHWSPDGRQLASADYDYTIGLWNAETGSRIAIIRGHRSAVQSLEWSPDGKRLVSGGWRKSLKVWDLPMMDREAYREYPTGTATTWSVCWSPDGTRLASGGDGELRWWDARGEAKPVVLIQDSRITVKDISWNPDATRLAAACGKGKIMVWDPQTRQLLRTIAGHSRTVTSVCWSPDGTQLASASCDGSISTWDAATGDRRTLLRKKDDIRVHSVRWSPDGTMLASCGKKGLVVIWDAVTGKQLRTLKGHGGSVFAVAWSPDGKKLASAGDGRKVILWDVRSGQRRRELTGHTGLVSSVCWSPDATRVATTGHGGTVLLWDVDTGKAVLVLAGPCRLIERIDWSSDGTRLAGCGRGSNNVAIWDASIGYQRHPTPTTAPSAHK